MLNRGILACVASVSIFIGGCGGSGGGSSGGDQPPPPPASTTVSGTISDDPVANAQVQVRDLAGAALGSTQTDSTGKYSVAVTSGAIASGYQIVATGGQVAGSPFIGELRAVYAVSDAPAQANATLVTTLVARLAERETTGDLVAKRNAVLDRLASVGALQRAQWNAAAPENVNLPLIRADIGDRGFDVALSNVAALTTSTALASPTPELFVYFPAALGGVVGVSYGRATSGTTFDVFPGDPISSGIARVVTASPAGSALRFELTAAPAGMTVDAATGALRFQVPVGATASYPFSLRVTSAVGSRTLSGSVNLLTGTVLASAIATGSQQTIADSSGQYSITLDAGLSPPGTRFSIVSATDSLGRRTTAVRAEGAVNATGGITVSIPPGQPIAAAQKSQTVTATQEAPIRTVSAAVPLDEQLCGPQSGTDSSDVPYVWGRATVANLPRQSEFSNFAEPYGRIPQENQASFRMERFKVLLGNGTPRTTADLDAVLCGPLPQGDVALAGAEPVLFIHGYTVEALGPLGAEPKGSTNGTFGDLLHPISDPTVVGSNKYKPFLFRWRTNQRFEDAALALKEAVELIKSKTGRDVHIVAHSFGGVLTRVYLQGLTYGGSTYDTPVASVTSFGSPYSGVFPATNSAGFPEGFDRNGSLWSGGGAASACAQLSCFQMGDDRVTVEAVFKAGVVGSTAIALYDPKSLVRSSTFLRKGFPIHSYIGLRTTLAKTFSTGDGLISFEGQRFLADDRFQVPLRRGENVGGAIVSEYVLGGDESDSSRSVDLKASMPLGFFGYGHTLADANFFSTTPAYAKRKEVDVKCKGTECSKDETVKAILRTLQSSASSGKTYTIGATVTGLTGNGLLLQNNGDNGLTVNANGSYTFSKALTSGAAYVVGVQAQPSGQICTVTNGSGTVVVTNVTGVSVNCLALGPATYTVGGTIAGLTGQGLVLRINGGSSLVVAANGAFAFPAPLGTGQVYSVTVQSQPAGQVCLVVAGSGTVANASVTNVSVNCGVPGAGPFTIGGTVTGLTGSGLVLRNNGGDNRPVAGNGAFVFPTALASGAAYSVTVATQPSNPSQTCSVSNGSGTVGSSNVSNVVVACVAGPTYTIGGTVSGLTGSGLVLRNNGGDNRPVAGDGAFAFPTALASGAAYSITVATQPSSPSQTCSVTNGSGVVGNGNVSNVAVVCAAGPTYTVGGTVTGLTGSGLVLRNNGGDDRPVTGNGAFVFATALSSGAAYSVTVVTQPSSPSQTCTVTSGSGTVGNGNVSNVAVNCVASINYTIGGSVSGLSGSGLVLRNNGADDLTLNTNGAFVFATNVASGGAYSVTVLTQPANPAQSCSVTNGSGTVGNANVSNVSVSCGAVQVAAAAQTIAAGDTQSMIIRADKALLTAGSDVFGELGGTASFGFDFEVVLAGVKSVSAGGFHSLALKADGTLWATGRNLYGQLGTGDNADRSQFVQVLNNVASIETGGFQGSAFSFALKADGTLWATGRNSSGQLGVGDTSDRNSYSQVLSNVRSVAAGFTHTLALKTDGTLWATGDNVGGAFGNGGTASSNTFVQVATDVQEVAAGELFSLILKTDGTLWATGSSTGSGNTPATRQPVQVLSGVKAVSSFMLNSLALKTDGTVWATGNNMFGQLGTGDTLARASFVQVFNGAVAISTGTSHSLVLRSDGTVWGAGYAGYLGLGLGASGNRTTFVQIFGGALVPP